MLSNRHIVLLCLPLARSCAAYGAPGLRVSPVATVRPALLLTHQSNCPPTHLRAAPAAPRCSRVNCIDGDAPEPAPLVLDGTSKLQLSILLSTNFLVQLGIGMLITILPLYAQTLGFGALGVGLIIAVPQLAKLLLNLPVGHLVDVVGRKPPLVLGTLLDGIGQLLTAGASTISSLVPARLVVGVGSAVGSVTGPATTAYTQDVLAKYPEHAGVLNGIVQAVGFLAFAVGPALGGWLGTRYSPALPVYLLGAAQLICVPLKLLLPETLPPERRKAAGLRGLRVVMDGLLETYRTLLADPKQRALLAMKCAFLCGLSLILTIVPLHATAAWGASAADLGRVLSAVTILSIPVGIGAGALVDRFGRLPFAVGGSLTTALAVSLMPLVSSRAPYYALRVLWGVGEAFLITAYSTLALDLTPEAQRGARNSLDNQVGDLALLFLPVLIGVVGQVVSFNAAFWLAGALMLSLNLWIVRTLRL